MSLHGNRLLCDHWIFCLNFSWKWIFRLIIFLHLFSISFMFLEILNCVAWNSFCQTKLRKKTPAIHSFKTRITNQKNRSTPKSSETLPRGTSPKKRFQLLQLRSSINGPSAKNCPYACHLFSPYFDFKLEFATSLCFFVDEFC